MVLIASDIPLWIIGLISSFVIVLLSLGYVYRTSFPMSTTWFISGAIFLLIFISVNTISNGYTDERSILTSSVFISGQQANDTTIVHMNTTVVGTGSMDLNNGGTIFIGEQLGASSSLIGDSWNGLQFAIQKVGSPTGTIYTGYWDSTVTPTSANVECLINTLDVSTLSTSRTIITFENANDICQATSSDAIGIFYDGGSVGNALRVYQSTAGEGSLFDGTNTFRTHYSEASASWVDDTARDISMAVFFTIDIEPEDSIEFNSFDTVGHNAITFDIKVKDTDGNYTMEPNFIGIMLIILSLSFIMIGVLIERD